MQRVTHWGWAATALLFLLVVWNWVYSFSIGSRTSKANARSRDAQKRTNERLQKVEESNQQITEVQTAVKSMSEDLHMIKQFLMEKDK